MDVLCKYSEFPQEIGEQCKVCFIFFNASFYGILIFFFRLRLYRKQCLSVIGVFDLYPLSRFDLILSFSEKKKSKEFFIFLSFSFLYFDFDF